MCTGDNAFLLTNTKDYLTITWSVIDPLPAQILALSLFLSEFNFNELKRCYSPVISFWRQNSWIWQIRQCCFQGAKVFIFTNSLLVHDSRLCKTFRYTVTVMWRVLVKELMFNHLIYTWEDHKPATKVTNSFPTHKLPYKWYIYYKQDKQVLNPIHDVSKLSCNIFFIIYWNYPPYQGFLSEWVFILFFTATKVNQQECNVPHYNDKIYKLFWTCMRNIYALLSFFYS